MYLNAAIFCTVLSANEREKLGGVDALQKTVGKKRVMDRKLMLL